jgi:glycosyltransferase involved in cell wall biosynthesis
MTSPFTVNAFWSSHLDAMRRVYEVTVMVQARDARLKDVEIALPDGVALEPMPLRRSIDPLADLVAIAAVRRALARIRPDAVVSMTPKGGLVGMLAARMSGVPVRLHWFTGQVWATRTGLMRRLLKTTDTITARAATSLLADSHTQADVLANEGIAPRHRFEVLGSGSVSGVDCARFAPDPLMRQQMRSQLGLAASEVALIFAGRINREKGIPELMAAYRELRAEGLPVRLVIVGPDEDGLLATGVPEGTVLAGYTRTLERYFQASDIFCLPSHREGFPTVVLEAGACGLPTAASRVYGIVDAVLDEATGLLHPPKDAAGIARTVRRLVEAPHLRASLGTAARARAVAEFSSARMTSLLMARIGELLNQRA